MTILNANREDYILGAAGLSSAKSPWLVYHILTGTQIDAPKTVAPITAHFLESMIRYAEKQYGATIVEDGFCTTFHGDFEIEQYLRVEKPGDLPCNPGDVILIEMLESNTLKFVWKVNHDMIMPWTVRARATIRMHAAGARSAIVWIISDQGATDEMHHLEYEEQIARHLISGCESMKARIQRSDEPDPSDEDLLSNVDFDDADGAGHNSTRTVAETDELAKTFALYKKLSEEATAANRAKTDSEKAVKPVKAKLLRELDKTPRLIFPDGTRLSAKTIKVKAQQRDGYQFQKLLLSDKAEGGEDS